ncbi:MAG: EexN family lipoprotein, partial [Steroidobacteraceae bacterium]
RFRPGARSVRLCLEIVVTLSAVTACAPAPKHSVGYYRSHATLRQEVLERCTNDPGDEGRTPDCINARSAENIEGIGSLKSLPPMGLPTGPGAPSRP